MSLELTEIKFNGCNKEKIIESNKDIFLRVNYDDVDHEAVDKDIRELIRSTNNFTKSIELLKELVQHLEWREDFIVEDAEENDNSYKQAKDFLKSLEE